MELDLYKFFYENNIEYYYNNNEIIVLLDIDQIDNFIKIIGEDWFEEGGMEVTLHASPYKNYIGFDITDILENYDLDANRILPKERFN